MLEELARSDGGGYPHALSRVARSLPAGTDDRVVAELLESVAAEYVRALPERESTQFHVSREIANTRDGIREVLDGVDRLAQSVDAAADFDAALNNFHPWRQGEAREIRASWAGMTSLVIQLANSERRGSTLTDWSASPPPWVESAPPALFGWLGQLATESTGTPSVAAHFYSVALTAGISPRVDWRLKLYQQLPSPSPDAADWFESDERAHPVVSAIIAEQQGDLEAARGTVEAWRPGSDPERAQRAAILARSALLVERFVEAVELGTQAYESWQSTGAGLVAVDALFALSGTRRDAAVRLGDVRAALELATRILEDRRRWGVDAVPALSSVVRALEVLDDPERALGACLPRPHGTASISESQNPAISAEAVRLAARLGRDLPSTYVDTLPPSSAQASARAAAAGYAAARAGDEETAAINWLEALEREDDPLERLELATQLAFLGREVDTSNLIVLGSEVDWDEELRLIARLFRQNDPASLAAVRAGALTRRSFATALYEFHLRADEYRLAAEVMVRSARQWGEPSMWLRAARAYATQGDHADAVSAARQVLEGGIASTSEERSALICIAEAASALGHWHDARTATLRLLESDPASEALRWAHIRVLFEAGDPDAALSTYTRVTPRPEPRSGDDALLVAQLHRIFGDEAIEASELVRLSDPWRDDESVRGRVLLCILLAPRNAELDDAEEGEPSQQTLIVRQAMTDFTSNFPTSTIMYSIDVDPANPLDSLMAVLGQSPDTSELDAYVVDGRAPMGFAASIHSRTYAEVIVRRPTPARFLDHPTRRAVADEALAEALAGGSVVLDTTVAFTLSLLESGTRAELIGSLPDLSTASELVADSREAALALDRESGMTFAPNATDGRPIRFIPDDQLERFRWAARAVLDTMRVLPSTSAATVRSADDPLPLFGGRRPTWLAAVDLARVNGAILWADDRVLRDMASQMGVRSFATIDLVGALVGSNVLRQEIAEMVRAILVANTFVGQAVSSRDFANAGDLLQWRDDALAVCLRFGEFATVEDRIDALERSLDGAREVPELLGGLVYAFASWVLETPAQPPLRDGLMTATITGLLAKPWLDAATLPFILDGVRAAYVERGQNFALQGAVRNHFDALSRVAGPATAATHLRGLFSFTRPEDRFVVTEVTFTTRFR